MDNAVKSAKYLTLIVIVVIATGCNTMVSNLASIKYGQLYTMQEVFDTAVNHCEDAVARTLAIEWSSIGYRDLDRSRSYMERGSEKHIMTRRMMRRLSHLSSHRVVNDEKLCTQIESIAAASRDYLANIESAASTASIEEEIIVVAITRHHTGF